MTLTKWKGLFFWIIAILFFVGCLLIQWKFFLNFDNSDLLYNAQSLLAGGNYFNNFFEINPPMILYLYSPPILFSHWFSIQLVSAFRIYIAFLVIITLVFSYEALRKIFQRQYFIIYGCFLCLIFILLLMPTDIFGEREHIAIILTMPYFFLTGMRIQNISVNKIIAFIIGLLSTLGFLIKPFFLAVPCLIELYIIFYNKSLTKSIRIETIEILIVTLLYILSVFYFTPLYITKVLPMNAASFLQTMREPFWLTVTYPPAVACFLIILTHFITWGYRKNNPLENIIVLGIVGFSVNYFWQSTPWFYHILPTFSLSCLLVSLWAFQALQEVNETAKSKIPKSYSISLLFLFFLSLFPLYTFVNLQEITLLKQKPAYQAWLKIITITKKYAKDKYIFSFSSMMTPTYPLIHYTNNKPALRFANFRSFIALLNKERSPSENALLQFIVQATVQDFIKYQPTLVFVDVSVNKPYAGKLKIDYIRYFSQYKTFKKAWKQYHLLTQIGRYQVYLKLPSNGNNKVFSLSGDP